MSNEKELLARLIERWQGACQDKSGSDLYGINGGKFSFTIAPSNAGISETLTRLSGVPSSSQQQSNTWTWESVADTVFVDRLPKHIPGYEIRKPQLHMARLIQRAYEMGQHAVVEAGTGTGKSYAYLYPAMELGLRIIVSTSNKNLQGQLKNKDIPTVFRSYPSKTVAVAQGKSNYACIDKASNVTLTGQLAEWYNGTESGNTEDINFSTGTQELSAITADDTCTGRKCKFYSDCFYYKAKHQRESADIVVCNHALLAIHLANPDAKILPEVDMIIVDEAHKLIDYIRSAHASEIKLSSIQHYIDIVKRANLPYIHLSQLAEKFIEQISVSQEAATIPATIMYVEGAELSKEFLVSANNIYSEDEDTPQTPEQRTAMRNARNMRKFSASLFNVSNPTQGGYVRYTESKDKSIVITLAPWNVADIMSSVLYPSRAISRSLCAQCLRDLPDTVCVLNNRGYCAGCMSINDAACDAELMSFDEYIILPAPRPITSDTPFVFCSATLATPDLSGFMQSLGIAHALQMIAPSPFNYEKNALLYIPNGSTPSPRKETLKAWEDWLPGDMLRCTLAAGGGAFLLFSSYRSLNNVMGKIRAQLEEAGLRVLVQGTHTKAQIIAEFRTVNNCVLFATKSFWEGVDIQGDNLRLIYIDKIPFAPPHPITQAIKDSGAGDWFTVDLPNAIQDLKQGTGRLIRTASDRGVIAIGDPDIRNAQYGRRSILPSLPPATLVHDYFQVNDFFTRMEKDRKLTAMEQFAVQRAICTGEAIEIDGEVF